MIHVQDPDFTLHVGDVRDVLKELPDESVDCVVTSPPFYGLRDYGVDGQIGLEPTPEEWAAQLVSVFRECRRLLKPNGTLWVECGDSYSSDPRKGGSGTPTGRNGRGENYPRGKRIERGSGRWGFGNVAADGLKPKDLMGTPWLLAFALRADGWWLRQAIIWHKPNAMPESAKDRCTTAHSYVFLLSKSARYHFDAEAIAEEFSENTHSKGSNSTPKSRIHEDGKSGTRQNRSFADSIPLSLAPSAQRRVPQVETLDGSGGEAPRGPDGRRVTHVEQGPHSVQHRSGDRWPQEGRSARSVWTIPTQGYAEAHFATWPEKLAERIILAGCPEQGVVLDPFMGSGTTALVARKLGRKSVGIELNETYAELAAKRLSQLSLLAQEGAA